MEMYDIHSREIFSGARDKLRASSTLLANVSSIE